MWKTALLALATVCLIALLTAAPVVLAIAESANP